MFRFLLGLKLVVLLGVGSLCYADVQLKYEGEGQAFSEAGVSRPYKASVVVLPGASGDYYQFARATPTGEMVVSNCFVLQQDALHEDSRDTFKVLAPDYPSQSSCGDSANYRQVGWAHAWSDEESYVSFIMTITTITGEEEGGYLTIDMTRSSSDDGKELLEIVGFAVTGDWLGQQQWFIRRYWKERYELITY